MCGPRPAAAGLQQLLSAICGEADRQSLLQEAVSRCNPCLVAAAVACQAQAARRLLVVLGSSHAAYETAVFAPFSAGLPYLLASCMTRQALRLLASS